MSQGRPARLTTSRRRLYRVVKSKRLVLLSLVLVLACTCAPKLEPVSVEFAGLSVERMETAVVKLRIINPNPFSVAIEDLRYHLLLADDTVAIGARRVPVNIQASDTTEAEFPMTFRVTVGEMLSQLPGLMSDTVWVRIDGRYSLPTAFGPKRRPFHYRDVIPLRKPLEEFIQPFKDLFGVGEKKGI